MLFVILLLPAVQHAVPFITSGPLFGYYTNAPDVTFSTAGWLNGSYQKSKAEYLNDHVGFRPDFLRINGQIDYSLFYKANYGGTVVGRDNFLFYDNYISAYYGLDYAGYPRLLQQMTRLKALQDTFTALGKTLIMVYAPCKAWYCSENIDPPARRTPDMPSNYLTCRHIGDSLGIDQIDLNEWFLQLKSTTRELLYSRQGIHWTNYGSILGGDSIIRYIEHMRNIKLPHPHWNSTIHTTEARNPDNDMGKILNLIWPVARDTFCYPELSYTTDSDISHINAIHIGDSYNINLITTGLMQQVYGSWQFWFSFKNVFNEKTYDGWTYPQIVDTDWKGELARADCIILLNTPKNTDYIASGFIDSAYQFYFPGR